MTNSVTLLDKRNKRRKYWLLYNSTESVGGDGWALVTDQHSWSFTITFRGGIVREATNPDSYDSIASKLAEARFKPLSKCHYKFLSPVEKLSEPKTHAPWEKSTCPAVTVRLKDILNESGKSCRPVFNEIKKAGSIHAHLGFEGNVILSSVMPDKMIDGFTKERFAEIVDELKPNYWMTSDGETYNKEPNLSEVEINRMMDETKYMLDNAGKSKAIGLVKGCNPEQIGKHIDMLGDFGIEDLVFHTGDFLARGSNEETTKAREYTRQIRKKARMLLLYGIGIQIPDFFVADGFITQSHYSNAFYGQKLIGEKWVDSDNTDNRDTIMDNLSGLDKLVIKRQASHLSNWVVGR